MAKSLAVGLVIGATLAGSFKTAIGDSVSGIGRLGNALDGASGQARRLAAEQERLAARKSALPAEIAAAEDAAGKAGTAHMSLARALGGLRPASAAAAEGLARAKAEAEAKAAAVQRLRGELGRAEAALTSNAKSVDALAKSQSLAKASTEAFGKAGAALAKLGAFGAGLGVMANQAIGFDGAMRDAAIVAGIAGREVDAYARAVKAAARAAKQDETEMVGAFGALLKAGVDKDLATASLEAIGAAAKATRQPVDAVAKIAGELMGKLGVAPEGLSDELSRLAKAGQEGGIGMAEIAQQFPALAAAAGDLKMSASEAISTFGSMLAAAKKSGGMDAGAAAGNLAQLFGKISSPELAQKLADQGVYINRVMRESLAKGGNPMEAVFAEIDKVLTNRRGHDEGKRDELLAQMFPEPEVKKLVKSIVKNADEVKAAKARIAEDGGQALADLKSKQANAADDIIYLGKAIAGLGSTIGGFLLPPLAAIARPIAAVVGWLQDFAESSPIATSVALTFGATLAAAAPVLGLIKWGVMGVTLALRAMTVAALMNPFVWIPIAIAGIVALVVHWEEAVALLVAGWEKVKKFGAWLGLGKVGDAAPSLSDGMANQAAVTADASPGLAAARASESKVEAVMKFENVPRGATVEEKTRSGQIDFGMDLGYAWPSP